MLCPGAVMTDARAHKALERIDRALARIEAAASRRGSGPPPEDYEQLRGAHDALRRRVAGAIGQIDRMLETGEAR